MPQNVIDKLKDLTHDPIGIGILASAIIAVVAFILTSVSLVKQNSLDVAPNDGTTVKTNNEITGDPGKIGDKIWLDINRDGIYDESEQGMAGISVNLIELQTKQVKVNTTTDVEGKYEFADVPPGEYEIQVVLPLNLIPTALEAGENRETDSNITLVEASEYGLGRVGKSNSFILESRQENLSIDGGVHTFEEVSGVVWVDANSDGQRNEADMLVEGIIVSLLGENEEVIDSKVTSNGGSYIFTSMKPGKYSLKFESNQDYATQDPATSTATLQQITSTPKYTDVMELQAEQKISNMDQMMYELTSEIKLQIVNREREGENPSGVVEDPTQTTVTPEATASLAEEPTATATLEEVPAEGPVSTATIETQTDDSTGTGSDAQATTEVQSEGSSNLVRTGLPIFILALLGGGNLFMLKFANTDKNDEQMRKRKARRYSYRM